MQTIRDLLARDLSAPIEEVIKLDQQEEQTVFNEIGEYVATQRIKKQYLDVLGPIADGPGEPNEGVGVWVSGFFGSGKSSFAKNLGYVLANRSVMGQPAGQLFIQRLEGQAPGDPLVKDIADRIAYINSRVFSHVMMIDVQVDRAVRRFTEPIAEIMYTVLLRQLDYAEDYDVAELEIDREREGSLADLVRACTGLFSDQLGRLAPAVEVPRTLPDITAADYACWQRVRKGAERIQRISAALHVVDAATYPTADSWAASLKRESDITVRTLVERTFELTARRKPGFTAVFIVDEVGQYVARSADKIENLRAVVEHFGQESKNRVLAGRAAAPVWIVVTSQEKLEEVVSAIDDKRVELAKLQDRFKTRVDMAPADIREVASRRVLAKQPAAEPALRRLYDESAATLKTHTRLERTSRRSEVEPDEFVQFYPYLPHFIDLSIDIVSGIRLQPGAPKQIGGSARTLIKQAYEVLVNERTGLAAAPVGSLVSLDMLFDLLEGNLSSEKQKDISDILQRWPEDPWPARVAKAIALLEFVRDLPRSEANLAALLYRRLGDESPLPHVERAVGLLHDAQFIRQTEYGWKLQTAQEKSWIAERNAFNPTPRERNELLEDRLRAIFTSANLSHYAYRRLRTFKVGVSWDGRSLTSGEGQVPLALRLADGPEVFGSVCEQAREESRVPAHRDEIFWVMSLTADIDEVVAELYRSRRMVNKYDQLRAKGDFSQDISASLEAEKSEVLRLEDRLSRMLEIALADGRGIFRGVARAGAALGKTLGEILKGMLDGAVPELYQKLEMGARPLKGNEAEEILKAANLTGLSKVFYRPPDGLELVASQGSKYVVNLDAPILKEVLSYLAREHSYGTKVTGRTLEAYFGGIGYGWERDMLWLVLATLLRGGAIEMTTQGRRYRNHLDPQARLPFSGTNAFRATSFAPRKAIDLQTLVAAAQRYESLTGDEVDVEESAIAQAFQRLARAELEALLPVEATVRAHDIPLGPLLAEYHTTLDTILNSSSDDCVTMLAGEGVTFQQTRQQVTAVRQALDQAGLARLHRARAALQHVWPVLQAEGLDGELAGHAGVLKERLQDGSYYQVSAQVDRAVQALGTAYRQHYQHAHEQRQAAFRQAADDVKAQASWPALPADMQAVLLKPLNDRAGHDLNWSNDELRCGTCRATLAEMASDLAAVERIRSDVLLRLQQLSAPEEKVERVRFGDVAGVGQTLTSAEEVDDLLEQLREYLLRLVAAGVKVVLE